MTVKELVDKLSLLDDDVEVMVGYGDIAKPLNFIFPRGNHIVLHPAVYYGDKVELWLETLACFHKKGE